MDKVTLVVDESKMSIPGLINLLDLRFFSYAVKDIGCRISICSATETNMLL